MLATILGSKGRAEILKCLFTLERRRVHLRALSRSASISAPVLKRELQKLSDLSLIITEKDGNRVYFSANHHHHLYAVLCQLVQKTEGSEAILRDCFSDCPAKYVFLFGSFASGTAHAASDIDLFVIGDCGLREVTRRIHLVADKIGREINPYVISEQAFLQRKNKQDHFILEIIQSPKIFLKGTPDEFVAMGNERMAETP